jgi:nucleotide-binding universal stress UspA family protein
MVNVARILFATDLSPDSTSAFELAKETARRFGAEVIVLHVDEGAETAPLSPAATARRQEARLALTRTCDELAGEGIPASALLRTGDSAREILRVASDRGAGMIVIGTHGQNLSKNLLLGSVADRVLRYATIPVLTVRHPSRFTAPPWPSFAFPSS